MISKADLRKKVFLERRCLKDKIQKEKSIAENLFSMEIFEDVKTVLLYCGNEFEVSTEEIFLFLKSKNMKIAFPFCVDKIGHMEFYFDDYYSLTEGSFKIKEPNVLNEKVTDFSHSICIVPGLAFSKKGERLGYGRGYYDRFLKNFEGISVGLSFSDFLFDSLFQEENDIKTDYVVTDKKIYYRKHEEEQNGRSLFL